MASERILDIGCGAGEFSNFFPQNEYVGLDINPNYIRHANRYFSKSNHSFLNLSVNDLSTRADLGKFDLAIAFGLLHHLDDKEVIDLLKEIPKFLKPTGKFVSVDPCFHEGQNPLTRFVVKNDRGNHVRYLGEYQKLAKSIFQNTRSIHFSTFIPIPASVEVVHCFPSA